MVDQIEWQKACWVENFLFDTDENLLLGTDNSSLQLQRTVYKEDHSVFQYPDYLSTVKCYPHTRLISRFRCGLRVDTGHIGKGIEHCSREDRVCCVCICMSGSVEREHHRLWLFGCPAYSHIHQQYSKLFSSVLIIFIFSSSFSGQWPTQCVRQLPQYLLAQRQSVLTSPLLAWLVNSVELD